VRDRRGHGLLRLRLDRRVERRATWLDRQLRARRRTAWRSHRRLWASLLACYGLLMVGLAVLEAGHPVARAAMLGAVGTAAAGTLVFGLVLVDGTLLARLGRMTEEAVGDELRGTPGVYGVVSNLPFACSDVDHVVLAPAGVLAVEVKQIHGLRRGVSPARWSGMLEQARTGARRTTALLHQHGVDLQAWPVLVVAGAGAPELPSGRQVIDGVTVVMWRESDSWRPRLAGRQHLDLDTARRAADALLDYRTGRWDFAAGSRQPRQTQLSSARSARSSSSATPSVTRAWRTRRRSA